MSRMVTIVPRREVYDQHSLACDLYELLNPTRIYDQFFGNGISEGDLMYPAMLPRRRNMRPRLSSGQSEVRNRPNQFQVNLDVNQFSAGDLTVKVVDDCVVVTGKHEERSDEHGFVSREFTRRYVLPEGVNPDTVRSSLSREGVLTVEAPFRGAADATTERIVPITTEAAAVQPAGAVSGGENN